jgi:cysteine desulfurase family protein
MIYLDNAATSWPKPSTVIATVQKTMLEAGGNPGRGGHAMSMRASEIVHECRQNLATLFHVENPLRICFTSGATEALNLALKGLLMPGDHVICSSMEHNSVWRPLVALQARGVEYSIAQAGIDGLVSLDSIARCVRPQTRLIAIIHASNVNGAINPIAEIGAFARSRGLAFLVDAAQTAGSIPIDVQRMHVDLLAFPGHKGLLGPQGVGGLYTRESIELEPLLHGGTGSESQCGTQPDYLPDRYESGTLNTPGIAGLNEGVRYLLERGVERIEEDEWRLAQYMLAELAKLPGLKLYGPLLDKRRAPVVAFNIGDSDPVLIAEQLEQQFDIACRPGLHCAALAHRTQKTERTGTVRFSLGPHTTWQDVDTAIKAVRGVSAKGLLNTATMVPAIEQFRGEL